MLSDELRAVALQEARAAAGMLFGQIAFRRGIDLEDGLEQALDAVDQVYQGFLAMLAGTSRMSVELGTPREQNTTHPDSERGLMATITDTQEFDVTITTADGRGFATADALTYEVDDEAVVSVVGATDEDSHTATVRAGAPGSALVTITDSAVTPPLTAAVAVTVTAGPTVAVNITEGEPREQAPA